MRVLAHIQAFNDVDVIAQLLDALQGQTRRPDAILLVDNASTDGTLDKVSPHDVTIVRNSENLGPSGAIRIGFARAVEQGFDWTWVLDADTVPQSDVLEKLLAFFEQLPTTRQERVCFLNGWPLAATSGFKQEPLTFEGARIELRPLVNTSKYTECDCLLWTGSLYRTSAVARIGLPSPDYMMDVGEIEYGYRARQLGFTSYVVHDAVIHHDVGRSPAAYRFGPNSLGSYKFPPVRCYYCARNWLYFWLYQCTPHRFSGALRGIARSLAFTLSFAVHPITYRRQLIACIRGIRDGLTMHMERRY